MDGLHKEEKTKGSSSMWKTTYDPEVWSKKASCVQYHQVEPPSLFLKNISDLEKLKESSGELMCRQQTNLDPNPPLLLSFWATQSNSLQLFEP